MKRMKRILLWVLILLALLVAGCTASGATGTVGAADPYAAQAVTLSAEAQEDIESLVAALPENAGDTVVITLSGDTAASDGAGVTIDGGTVTITAAGAYALTGTLNGQIVVDAGKKDTVELILSGASVRSATTAAIYAKQSGLTVITLAGGTDNVLSDAASYVYPDAAAGEPAAALYSKDDLYIRGDGALTVYGNYANGIVTKDNLVIESGSIAVQAENHGIRGKDSVTVLGGTIRIDAGDDGIQSDNETDSGMGTIRIEGGAISIVSVHDGIQAANALQITDGEITIQTGGGYTVESYSAEESYKALKSYGTVEITGGTIYVNSLDDGIHAARSVTVSGGSLTLLSRDDGIHADETVNILGGDIQILICYEGLESGVVNVTGGTVSLLATDDGINAADASPSGQGDRMGAFDGMGSGDTSLQVNISGGTVIINADGDGVDSNGLVTMSGGALYISGPLSPANGALDYDTSFVMSGGVLVAAGSAGMAQTPGSNSSQPSVIVYFSQSQSAGPAYILADSGGNILANYTPAKDFQCIVFSAPGMKPGGAYLVYESADGMLSGATQLYSFTISGTITSVGASYGQTNRTTQQDMPAQRNDRR